VRPAAEHAGGLDFGINRIIAKGSVIMAPKDSGKLELLARKTFNGSPELNKVVDFLNKTLKFKKLMFGLTRDRETGEMTISIYEI
jgi:hypothetical protein